MGFSGRGRDDDDEWLGLEETVVEEEGVMNLDEERTGLGSKDCLLRVMTGAGCSGATPVLLLASWFSISEANV